MVTLPDSDQDRLSEETVEPEPGSEPVDSEPSTGQVPRLTEMIDPTSLQEMQDAFALAAGVASKITEPDGTPITSTSNFCRLCRDIIRRTETGLANCLESTEVIRSVATDGTLLRPCPSAGLWYGGAAIMIGRTHIANWLIGQVRDESRDPEKMVRYAREIGADEEEYRRALAEVPAMSEKRFRQICRALYLIANQLSGMARRNLDQEAQIAERQRAEEELRAGEERYRLTFEAIPDSVTITRMKDGKYIYVNKGYENQTGYSAAEVLGRTPADINLYADPADREMFIGILKRDGQANNVHVSFRRKNGDVYHSSFSARPFVYQGEDCLVALSRDITEQRLKDQALRESEGLFRDLVERLPFPVAVGSADLKTEYTNLKFTELFGYTAREIPDQKAWQEKFYPDPEYRARIARQVKGWVSSQEKIVTYQRRFSDRDGHLHDVIVHIMNLGNRFYNVIEDVTERKRIERQLRQSHKMEAIGTLAGGIAHDFNNILAAIIGYSELALEDARRGETSPDFLSKVILAGQRARNLVAQILSFSRDTDSSKRPLDLAELVEETLSMLRATIPTTIELNREFEPGRYTVSADPTQIGQVLINLCTNAADVMRTHGGRLTVGLDRISIDPVRAALHPDLRPGEYIHLTVADTGPGIDSRVRDKIFDPFFTTKEIGAGTGMGLSVVHGIVKSHDGATLLEDRPGSGACFGIYLPADELPTPGAENPGVEKIRAGGHESIMFVDDEQDLVDLNQQFLGGIGYRVTGLTSSREALEAFRADPEGFDLIMTDMTMPGLTGAELAREAMAVRPGIKVILCTGYSDQIDENEALAMGIKRLIIKPFSSHETSLVVRQVLDEDGS